MLKSKSEIIKDCHEESSVQLKWLSAIELLSDIEIYCLDDTSSYSSVLRAKQGSSGMKRNSLVRDVCIKIERGSGSELLLLFRYYPFPFEGNEGLFLIYANMNIQN